MFSGCSQLKIANLNNFNTSLVISMGEIFTNTKIKSLYFSSFDTRNVTNETEMFAFCKSLQFLNISSFDLNPELTVKGMFTNYNNDQVILIINSVFNQTKIIRQLPDIFVKRDISK